MTSRKTVTGRTAPLPRAWAQTLDAWSVAMRGDARAESTIAKRVAHLSAFVRETEPSSPDTVTLDDLRSWVQAHAGTPATATLYRASLRMFYGWAHKTGRTSSNPSQYLTALNDDPRSPQVARPVGSSGPLPLVTPAEWEKPITQWQREQRARGLSMQTLETQVAYVRRLARALAPAGPFEPTFYDLIDWLAPQPWAVETRRSARAALRSFYAWALDAGHVEVNPAARLPRVAPAQPKPHPASEAAVHFAVLTATPRERLMVRLAAELGLRRNEVAQAHTRDLLQQDAGWSLIVHGKGSRDRVIPLHDELASELRSLEPGWVFPSDRGGHLTARTIGKLVTQLLPSGVTMHALRHRFATRAYAMTHDVFVVQQLLGHANPETTRRYVEVTDDSLRSAVTMLAAASTRSVRALAA